MELRLEGERCKLARKRSEPFIAREDRRDMIKELSESTEAETSTKIDELIKENLQKTKGLRDGKKDGKDGGKDGKDKDKEKDGKDGKDGKDKDGDTGKEASDPVSGFIAKSRPVSNLNLTKIKGLAKKRNKRLKNLMKTKKPIL